MANDDCKAGSRLSQRKTHPSKKKTSHEAPLTRPQPTTERTLINQLAQQLMAIEDQLNELYACQQFFSHALYQINSSEDLPTPLQFGAHLNSHWLQEKTEGLLKGLTRLQQQLRDSASH